MPAKDYALSFSGEEGSEPQGGSEPRFLVIGQVVSPVGLRGELKVDVMTDFPERFALLRTVYLGEEMTPYTLSGADLRPSGRQVVLRLQGCKTIEQAEELRGQMVWIPIEEAVVLPEGQYYVHQVLGLAVETEAGEPLGRLKEVLATGSNDVYVVSDGQREVLIPVLEEVILNVDLAAHKMVVHLPEGLI